MKWKIFHGMPDNRTKIVEDTIRLDDYLLDKVCNMDDSDDVNELNIRMIIPWSDELQDQEDEAQAQMRDDLTEPYRISG